MSNAQKLIQQTSSMISNSKSTAHLSKHNLSFNQDLLVVANDSIDDFAKNQYNDQNIKHKLRQSYEYRTPYLSNFKNKGIFAVDFVAKFGI